MIYIINILTWLGQDMVTKNKNGGFQHTVKSKGGSMKEHSRDLIGFSVVFISLFLFTATFVIAAGDNVPSGQKLYETKCTQCHGKDAKGVAKMAKVLKVELTVVDLTQGAAVTIATADKIKIVTTGQKKMPKFKGKLTDEQIQDVVKYLESLQAAGAEKK
jgi:cytochrome c6